MSSRLRSFFFRAYSASRASSAAISSRWACSRARCSASDGGRGLVEPSCCRTRPRGLPGCCGGCSVAGTYGGGAEPPVGAPELGTPLRSEEHTSELQSHVNLVCRLLLEKKKKKMTTLIITARIY